MRAVTAISIFLIPLVLAFASGVKLTDEAKQFIEECRKEHNLELDQIKEAFAKKKVPEGENGKCFIDCMMVKAGVLENDKFDVEKAKLLNAVTHMDAPDLLKKADGVIDKCSSEVENPGGKCEYATELVKCAIKYAKELGIPAPAIVE